MTVAVAEKEVTREVISDHVRELAILVFKATKQEKPNDPTLDSLISVFQSDDPISGIKFMDESHENICISHPGDIHTTISPVGTIMRFLPVPKVDFTEDGEMIVLE